MGNSYENVGRFGKGYVSFRLIRKCRAIWQIARTIYQIVLQIFIPLGAPKAHGELLRKCRAIWQIARWTIYQIVLQIFIHLGAP
ncbi:MAG: hypothetical protein V9G20_07715 [Candidatus Promineifilaceae bacterium]